MSRIRWCGALLWFYALTGACADYGFRVLNAELVPVDEQYVLNAEVDYRFSQPVIEALQHGVPLTLVLRLQIKHHRQYWFDDTVLDASRRLHIRYQPLDKSFLMFREGSRVSQNFASLSTLLDMIGIIRGWRVLPVDKIIPGRDYAARLKASLDIEDLPLPLRPVAYASPDWYLGGPWFRWHFAR